ncbi:MAG: SGNH/GDSL hydrolase family protein [Thermoleophilaceae bacterium]|nr:SGNH/GDSL hydrolase family protein [Thermoleophilaceae bacterium]
MQHALRRLVPTLAVVVALAGAAPAVANDRYVALGDSYSSGVGTRDYSLDSTCQRSPYAYPAIIDRERPNTDLTFVACSGAKTSDVLANQVQYVTSSTNIVTITIGGNDAGFSSVISQCALPWPYTCDGDIANAQSYIRNTLPAKLDQVYAAIKQRAPGARVLVLGYPRLFNGQTCNLLSRISTDEENKLNATADLLRDVTKARATAAGFTFLDAIPPFTGHAICSSSEWINGLSNPVSESYHPNRNGQRLGYSVMVRNVIG